MSPHSHSILWKLHTHSTGGQVWTRVCSLHNCATSAFNWIFWWTLAVVTFTWFFKYRIDLGEHYVEIPNVSVDSAEYWWWPEGNFGILCTCFNKSGKGLGCEFCPSTYIIFEWSWIRFFGMAAMFNLMNNKMLISFWSQLLMHLFLQNLLHLHSLYYKPIYPHTITVHSIMFGNLETHLTFQYFTWSRIEDGASKVICLENNRILTVSQINWYSIYM